MARETIVMSYQAAGRGSVIAFGSAASAHPGQGSTPVALLRKTGQTLGRCLSASGCCKGWCLSTAVNQRITCLNWCEPRAMWCLEKLRGASFSRHPQGLYSTKAAAANARTAAHTRSISARLIFRCVTNRNGLRLAMRMPRWFRKSTKRSR